ncbi:MAG: PLP-dependent aminotransferase family protein, partial [bacterium]
HEWPFSEQALRTGAPPISSLMRDALEIPGMISLAAGFVDQGSLPADKLGEVCRELFQDKQKAQAALQYGSTYGDPRLRRLIRSRFEREEAIASNGAVADDDVLIGNGSQ